MHTDTQKTQQATAAGQIVHGPALEALQSVDSESLDTVITDPPYGVRYRDRQGRTVANDGSLKNVLPVFGELYRAMKPDTVCISFYGWNRVDQFMATWREAGFRPIGHIVWKKNYASKRGIVDACHEQAYILAKGRPKRPAKPISDVQSWSYSGNRSHPTEKSVANIKTLVEAFSEPGDLVCDPFSGSGSTSVAAALLGRRYLGIELEQKYCELAERRLAGVASFMAK